MHHMKLAIFDGITLFGLKKTEAEKVIDLLSNVYFNL
jgi:hypothetical protein